MARLASDWVAALIGWDLNPLDSYSEFQARLYRRLSQRSRLRLARPTSDLWIFMPRQPRLDAPGLLQHVMARGIERRKLFLDDKDRESFLGRLAIILEETQAQCYAWALIPNHFHLLLRTGPIPLSKVMRKLMTDYAVTFNKRHKRAGHLFQNRYKSIICEEDPYLLEFIRYIHLNPLRAKLVQDLNELDTYPWSGHSAIVGHCNNPLVPEVRGRRSATQKTQIRVIRAIRAKSPL